MAAKTISWLRIGKVVCDVVTILLGFLLIILEEHVLILITGLGVAALGTFALVFEIKSWRADDARFAHLQTQIDVKKDRKLTAECRSHLLTKLSEAQESLKRVPVKIHYLSGNTDATSYAEALRGVFIDAGWNCEELDWLLGGMYGIEIYGLSPQSDAATEIIQVAFSKAGIKFRATNFKDKPDVYPPTAPAVVINVLGATSD